MTSWPDPHDFWNDKRVVVTGGAGFLGSFVVSKLRERGAVNVMMPLRRDYDLRQLEAITRLLADARPQVIIHLAARVGGIGANREHTAEFFYDNLMMSVPLMHEAWRTGVEKFVAIGAVCASKPNGQPRRKLDTSRAQALFGFGAQTTFEDGLQRTIKWYCSRRIDR